MLFRSVNVNVCLVNMNACLVNMNVCLVNMNACLVNMNVCLVNMNACLVNMNNGIEILRPIRVCVILGLKLGQFFILKKLSVNPN